MLSVEEQSSSSELGIKGEEQVNIADSDDENLEQSMLVMQEQKIVKCPRSQKLMKKLISRL